MSELENPSDAQTKYLLPEPLVRHTKACNWVPVGVEVQENDKGIDQEDRDEGQN